MNRISIDRADERVKEFLQSLAGETAGAVIELDGAPLLQVYPAQSDEHIQHALIARGRELVERARTC